MGESLRWEPSFYKEANGIYPVEEFLSSLPTKDQMRIVAAIEKVCSLHINAHEPLIRHLEGRLWELRAECFPNTYRLIYFVSSDRHMVFLHAFQKKTQKTPRREITAALRRYNTQRQRGS